MDPVTAFQVAAGVFQLIDFSMKLFSSCKDIRRHGSLVELHISEESTTKLREMINQLPMPQNPSDLRGPDTQLCAIGDSCRQTMQRLLDAIGQLKPPNGKRKRDAFRTAVKVMLERSHVQRLQDDVETYRRTLDTAMLLNIKVRLDTAADEQSDSVQQSKDEMNKLIEAVDRQRHIEEIASAERQRESTLIKDQLASISKEMSANQSQLLDDKGRERIKSSLYFHGINARRFQIEDAHKRTFNWIFDCDEEVSRPWDNFAAWAAEQAGVFWLAGRAGSGKSTLMRYLSHDKRTKMLLRQWAGPLAIITPAFFFWAAGSSTLRKMGGLFRTLLFQVVCQFEESYQWINDFVHTESDATDPLSSIDTLWTVSALKRCLLYVLSQAQDRAKFCLFIDGLDEFDGDREHLLEFILTSVKIPWVKLCVASRLYNVFETAFKESPQLHLHDLTRNDIVTYVDDRTNFSLEIHGDTALSAEQLGKLKSSIVEKANGVFLWVKLALGSILSGLQSLETYAELKARLNAIPLDVEKLYDHMLSLIQPSHREEASRLINLVCAALTMGTSTSVLRIALANHSSLLALDALSESPDEPYAVALCLAIFRRLSVRTIGILEVVSTTSSRKALKHRLQNAKVQEKKPSDQLYDFNRVYSVNFIHRTAFDFFKDERTWDTLQCEDSTQLNTHLSLIHADTLKVNLVFQIQSKRPGYTGKISDYCKPTELLKDMDGRTTLNHVTLAEKLTHDAKDSIIDRFLAEACRLRGSKWHFIPMLNPSLATTKRMLHALTTNSPDTADRCVQSEALRFCLDILRDQAKKREVKINVLPFIESLLASGVDYCERDACGKSERWPHTPKVPLLGSFLASAGISHATVGPKTKVKHDLLAIPRHIPLWFNVVDIVLTTIDKPTDELIQSTARDLNYVSILEAFVTAGGLTGHIEFATTIRWLDPSMTSDKICIHSKLSAKDALYLLSREMEPAIEQVMTGLLLDVESYSGIIYDEIRVYCGSCDEPKSTVSIGSRSQARLAELIPYPLSYVDVMMKRVDVMSHEQHVDTIEKKSSDRHSLTCYYNNKLSRCGLSGRHPRGRSRELMFLATIAEVLDDQGIEHLPEIQRVEFAHQTLMGDACTFRWGTTSEPNESVEGSGVPEIEDPSKWKTLFKFLYTLHQSEREFLNRPVIDEADKCTH